MRIEGYMPNSDFVSALEAGLNRIAFVRKNYAEAERWYGDVTTRFAIATKRLRLCVGGL